MKRKNLLGVVTLACALGAGMRTGATPVTMESLLGEMLDETAVTHAVTNWTGRMWSSRNTSGANYDRGYWVSSRRRGDVTECVMVDAKGPGAMTRLWLANTRGVTLRFYVDDDANFAYEGRAEDIASGNAFAGFPLAAKVSPNHGRRCAHNLYLPIPFAKSFKLVALCKPSTELFYNAECRLYAPGTAVEPFSTNVLKRAQGAVAAANAALQSPYVPQKVGAETKLDGEIAAGATLVRDFAGPGAIDDIALKVSGDDEPLRKVRVKMTFDGEATLDVALGQFFGCGYRTAPFSLRHLSCTADGLMRATRLMPFAKSATLEIVNTSAKPITLADASVRTTAYAWDNAKSMHFGGYGFDDRDFWTTGPDYDAIDVLYVRLRGEGSLLANHLSIDNTSPETGKPQDWWGEGDEKIRVDGAWTYLGTGTEDFFGYAYGPSTAFSSVHPFCALPLSDGRLTDARSIAQASREHALDVIPFTKELDLFVEVWHGSRGRRPLQYAPATFWYMRPGGKWFAPDAAKAADSAADDALIGAGMPKRDAYAPGWCARYDSADTAAGNLKLGENAPVKLGSSYTLEAYVKTVSPWIDRNRSLTIMGTTKPGKNGVYFGQGIGRGALFGAAQDGRACGELTLRPEDVPLGHTMHLAFVSRPDGSALYVNGRKYAEKKKPMPALDESLPFDLGWSFSPDRRFPGLVHAARAYPTALSDEAIARNAAIDRRRFAALAGVFMDGTLREKIAKNHRIQGEDVWHGFHRIKFDFNGNGAWIVEPTVPAAKGTPWTWTMQWADAFVDRTGVPALLKRGFHHVTIGLYGTRMNEDGLLRAAAFQKFLVEELGFAPKANLIGMSWGGFFSGRYAATYPQNVSKIYFDAPLLNFDGYDKPDHKSIGPWAKSLPADGVWTTDARMPVNMAEKIAAAKIPVYLLYGGKDDVVPPAKNCLLFIPRFQAAGGEIAFTCRPKQGHHPHGLNADQQQTFVDFFTK